MASCPPTDPDTMTDRQDSARTADKQEPDQATLEQMATTLVKRCPTMVIATTGRDGPWAAPVYYVWAQGAFWFYSSNNSRHIRQGLEHKQVAAALWEDSVNWRRIQGLQMQGRLSRANMARAAAVGLAYTAKFPQAAGILKVPTEPAACMARIGLYAFWPDTLIYTNNSFGLGFRRPVQLQDNG